MSAIAPKGVKSLKGLLWSILDGEKPFQQPSQRQNVSFPLPQQLLLRAAPGIQFTVPRQPDGLTGPSSCRQERDAPASLMGRRDPESGQIARAATAAPCAGAPPLQWKRSSRNIWLFQQVCWQTGRAQETLSALPKRDWARSPAAGTYDAAWRGLMSLSPLAGPAQAPRPRARPCAGQAAHPPG